MARRRSFGGYEEDRFENEVDSTLLCPICSNVLKDPVQCPNEHYCCRSCIVKHLHENSETCPTCQHHLTQETLSKPPRLLTNMLQNLKIRCDHAKRGCQELMKLEFLDRHVKSCGYSPTRCTNSGCSQIINQHEKERHENELCRFRLIVCDDCKQQVSWNSSHVHPCFMRKEMDKLARKRENDTREIKDEVKQVKLTQEEFIQNLMDHVARQNDVIDDLCHRMNHMKAEIEWNAKEASERCDLFTGRQKIFVCGGNDRKTNFNSVESYSWPANSWTVEPAMKTKRAGPSAFVHERQIYVSGGWTGSEKTDTIESLNVDEENLEWIQSPLKMPSKCNGHKMVSHENSVILTGGRDGDNVLDGIYEIKLNPPYTSKLLTQMLEPRCNHGCQIIDNQVVVAGGKSSKNLNDAKNTVYAYDLNNNECKTLPPLPSPITDMASVSYKGNVILIGGVNEKGQTLNSVVMYDVKTGKIKMLPCLSHKRAGSAAVITGNVIIVIGGYNHETETRLSSVECLDLSSNVWKELSPMTTKRGYTTAVIKPFS
ncbi:E3 ubiquitin- ligase NRDP1 [Paramuricea clavata]|uniref:E3 ubiquitin- ligase NRDP1 n=1 Tax=Paramuricea clavata TaxID=317549 RepID=A0A7D9DZ25_PARCT|nr:E3 ubiquitin- ligase NRDP1 [Paramuricea clavata]